MRFCKHLVPFLLISTFVYGQELSFNWYSETTSNGITIQNSFPKGGLYNGTVKEGFNHSYLVFFTRISNETGKPIEMKIDFSAHPINIPNSPNTYVKLFLPQDEMTLEKQDLFSYGITELKSQDESTSFQKKVGHNEACLFYVVALFYQTHASAQHEDKGGNRGEFFLEGKNLYYSMLPQIEALQCGTIIYDE